MKLRNVTSYIRAGLTERSLPIFASAVTGMPVPVDWGDGVARHDIGGIRPRLLYVIVRALRPDRVVETGVLHGVSSRAILAALEDNGAGHLTSVDLPTIGRGRMNADGRYDSAHVATAVDTGREVPAYLRPRWRLLIGTCKDHAGDLSDEAPVDLFIHDSDHTFETMTYEYTTAWMVLRPGGILLSDDTEWTSAFPDFARMAGSTPWRIRVGGKCVVGALRR